MSLLSQARPVVGPVMVSPIIGWPTWKANVTQSQRYRLAELDRRRALHRRRARDAASSTANAA